MPSFRPADLSLPCSPSCVGPNGLTERLTQGRLAPRPWEGMLNNPFRYLRRKWTMQSTDDELHCIRYSLLMPCPSASLCTYRLVFAGRKAINNPCTGLLHSE